MATGKTSKPVDDWVDVPAQQGADDWQDVQPSPAPQLSTGQRVVQGGKDFLAGIGSGGFSTGLGAYGLVRKIPGMSDVLPEPNEYMRGLATPPESLPGKVGHYAEQAAEYALPGGAAKGAGLARRMATAGLESAGVAGVQTGGSIPAMGAAGVVGTMAPAIPAAYRTIRGLATNPEFRDAAQEAAMQMIPKPVRGIARTLTRGGPEPAAPTPFQPGTQTKLNMPGYGGPGPSESGNTPGAVIPRRGPSPITEAAEEPIPSNKFAKGKATQANMPKYAGPQRPTDGGASRLPPRTPAPIVEQAAEEAAIEPAEPFVKGKQTLANMPRSGGVQSQSQQSFRGKGRSGINRAMIPEETVTKPAPSPVAAQATTARPPVGNAAQDLKESLTGNGGPGITTIKSTQPTSQQIARANKLAAGHNKYLSEFTGGKITAADVYEMKPSMVDQLESQIAAAKAGQLEGQPDIPKYASGGIVVTIPKRKPGRMSSRGHWYGPPGSSPTSQGDSKRV